MKILIIGANGQVGFELERALSIFGSIELTTRSGVSGSGNPCHALDLIDPEAVATLVGEVRPHVIVNASAYTQVDRAQSEPLTADAINHQAVKALARKAEEINALLIHFSTDYVYPGNDKSQVSESDLTDPQSTYGKSKLLGDLAVMDSGCAYRILRTQWVYAARGQNFLSTMLRLARAKQLEENPAPLRIVNDQFGAPTPASWLASTVAVMIGSWLRDLSVRSQSMTGVYHVVASGHCHWADFAREIFAQAKALGLIEKIPEVEEITTAEYNAPAPRPKYGLLSTRKLAQSFDLRLADWRQGVSQVLAEFSQTRLSS